jgi:tetratricopeptide (TPR) repeat protein
MSVNVPPRSIQNCHLLLYSIVFNAFTCPDNAETRIPVLASLIVFPTPICSVFARRRPAGNRHLEYARREMSPSMSGPPPLLPTLPAFAAAPRPQQALRRSARDPSRSEPGRIRAESGHLAFAGPSAVSRSMRTSVPSHPSIGAQPKMKAGTPPLPQLMSRAFSARVRGDVPEAERLCRQALASRPRYFDALHLLGVIALQAARAEEATELLSLAVATNRHSAEAANSLGAALRALDRHAEALASYDRAIALKPNFANAHFNRGNALGSLLRHVEAVESHQRAIALKPDYASAHYNRGNALGELLRHQEAIGSYRKAIALNPEDAKAHWNLAICHLTLGEYELGWKEHEWRWREEQRAGHRRAFAQPLWLGQYPLDGRTILLHGEQGLGDTLQFCRYVEPVAALGAKVVLEVQPALAPLLRNLHGAAAVAVHGAGLPAYDYHCPLMSLPLAFQTGLQSIPTAIPYIRSEPRQVAVWRNRLGEWKRPRIGLAWSGSATHRNDQKRSIALTELLPLLVDQIEWVSLQTEVRPADAALLAAGTNLRHFGLELADFSDTAAIAELMDLVIAVDTSAAHLAGAMGKPVWILLPFNPEWRWMLDRNDCPWYPTARLIRQSTSGDWASVIQTVLQDVMALFPSLAPNPGNASREAQVPDEQRANTVNF